MDIGGIVQGVLGGLVGGALVPLLTHSREKRIARSGVVARIAELDQVSRADGRVDDRDAQFDQCVGKFQAEAVRAGIPRRVVDLYVTLINVSFASSERNIGRFETGADGVLPVGPISGDLSAVVEASCGLLIDAVWHPVLSTITRPYRLSQVRRTANALADSDYGPTEDWGPWHTAEYQRKHLPLRNIRRRAEAKRLLDYEEIVFDAGALERPEGQPETATPRVDPKPERLYTVEEAAAMLNARYRPINSASTTLPREAS